MKRRTQEGEITKKEIQRNQDEEITKAGVMREEEEGKVNRAT